MCSYAAEDIINRVAVELNKRGIKQSELVSMTREVGMPVSHPDVSKILSKKKPMNLYQLAAFSKVLGISMDYFVWGEDGYRGDFCDFRNTEFLQDTGSELEYYKGEFYFYFLSTAQNEETKILSGKLHINKSDPYKIELSLGTGEKGMQGTEIIKEYIGRIIIASSLGTAYLLLKNEQIGELCMICLRHRSYSVMEMECRIGLALTTCAGDVKLPVVHKCLLVRKDLDAEALEGLRPWLALTGNEVSIEKKKLDKFVLEMMELFPDHAEEIKNIKQRAVYKEYAELGADTLRRQLSVDRRGFIDFLTKLHEAGQIQKNYTVSQAEDAWLYEKITELAEEVRTGKEARGSPTLSLSATKSKPDRV